MIYTSLNQHQPNVAEVWQPMTNRLRGDFNAIVLTYEPAGFKLDEGAYNQILQSTLPTVVFDMREIGWHKHDPDWAAGYLCGEFDYGAAMDQKLFPLNVVVTFVREYGRACKALARLECGVFPIDLISASLGSPPKLDKDEFMNRVHGITHFYGDSHPDRQILAHDLHFSDIPNEIEFIHYSRRRPLKSILKTQGEYQCAVALGGAGTKTWRHHESCWNAVPVIADVGVEFLSPFTKDNAILLPTVDGRINPDESLKIIKDSLANQDLMWHKMQGAHQQAEFFQIDNYMSYINKIIAENL